MRHKLATNRLGRECSHRKALVRNIITSLLRYERIRTTIVKAKVIRRVVEKLITRGKVDSVHNRRIVNKYIYDPAIVAKLFTDISPRFKNRPGGYTRILKLGCRPGDAAETVFLELVERKEVERKKKKTEVKEVKIDKEEKVEKAKENAVTT
jgi:large subunit ribosomal protein L17